MDRKSLETRLCDVDAKATAVGHSRQKEHDSKLAIKRLHSDREKAERDYEVAVNQAAEWILDFYPDVAEALRSGPFHVRKCDI